MRIQINSWKAQVLDASRTCDLSEVYGARGMHTNECAGVRPVKLKLEY